MTANDRATASNPQEAYMRRCLELAGLGAGQVAPNPMVGAVLVYGDRIIGEGFHRKYGGPHAEVNCLASVKPEDRALIPFSVLYVSLEPCAHFGKTPPCADLILRERIPEVVVGVRDPFPLVDGKGIEKLMKGGVKVTAPFLEKECLEINRRFFVFQQQKRSFIILKWAETADQRISGPGGKPIPISSAVSNRLVHRWRSEEAAILVGTNTALTDNPRLTTRCWPGKNPVRLALDLSRRLPAHLHLFDGEIKTFLLTEDRQAVQPAPGEAEWVTLPAGGSLPERIARAGHALSLQSILVEGGRQMLQSFLDAGVWDEIRRIESQTVYAGEGVASPVMPKAGLQEDIHLPGDRIRIFR